MIYGKYCSHVETAIALLDYVCKDKEDVRMKLEVELLFHHRRLGRVAATDSIDYSSFVLHFFPRRPSCAAITYWPSLSFFLQECSKRANYGKFTLRDLLVVPMQRVLKYPLLLQVQYCSCTALQLTLRASFSCHLIFRDLITVWFSLMNAHLFNILGIVRGQIQNCKCLPSAASKHKVWLDHAVGLLATRWCCWSWFISTPFSFAFGLDSLESRSHLFLTLFCAKQSEMDSRVIVTASRQRGA